MHFQKKVVRLLMDNTNELDSRGLYYSLCLREEITLEAFIHLVLRNKKKFDDFFIKNKE